MERWNEYRWNKEGGIRMGNEDWRMRMREYKLENEGGAYGKGGWGMEMGN